VIAAVAVAGLSLGCAEQSAAVRVGDRTVSESAMVDELDAFGSNEALFAPGQSADALEGELASSYDQQFVSEILQQRITFMLVAEVFEREGLELADQDRAEAEQTLASQLGGGLDAFPESYRDEFVDDVARYNALARELGPDEFDAALVEEADSTEITVSSRFGSWDESQFAVVPPSGSTPLVGSEGGVTDDPAAQLDPNAPTG
jgi:hypothetical protein